MSRLAISIHGTIDHNLCKKTGRIQSVDDLKNFKGLRTDLYDLFFSAISEIVSRPRYGRQRM